MFHLDQCQNFPTNHLYRTHHVRSSANRDSTSAEENDFDFWKQAHTDEDFGCYSPVLWETNTLGSNMKDEFSPLLPHNHHYSIPCPTPPRQAILQSRKDLMEMIQDMPESYYEISLKDIVDEQQSMQRVKEENDAAQKMSSDFHSEPQIRKQKSKKKIIYNTTRQISRTSSMETEIFLIKVFFPTFLGSKKKEKTPENRSKVSPRPSAGGPENHKGWSKIRSFFLNKKSGTSCSNRSTSSSNGSTRRFSDSNILTGCGFFHSKKSKRQRGLIS